MDQENIFAHLLETIARHSRAGVKDSLVEYHEPEELRQLLQLDQEGVPGDWDSLFTWVERYLDYAVDTSHPGFINRMWAGANLPSVIGEIVTAWTNTSACTYETAPVSTLMEKYLLQTMLALVGFQNGSGQMTTGSSNANMIAMLVARNRSDLRIKNHGLFGRSPLFAFVNAEAHYSMDRAANIIGIGAEHLVKVPVDKHGAMDMLALERLLEDADRQGGQPFFVAATTGTTVRGSYDALQPLLELRKRHGFWLHVDGAWGGAVLFSKPLRERYLAGLEQADSFSLDFHKMPGTALMCNVLLFNNCPSILRDMCSAGDESYIFREGADGDIRDLGTQSLQCGRRVDSLKWFLDWKFYGIKGFAQRIESYYNLAVYAEEQIRQSSALELVVPRESFNVCFRYRLPQGVDTDRFTQALRDHLHHQGRALIGTGFINGERIFRLLITNQHVDKPGIDAFLQSIIETGKELLATLLDKSSAPKG